MSILYDGQIRWCHWKLSKVQTNCFVRSIHSAVLEHCSFLIQLSDNLQCYSKNIKIFRITSKNIIEFGSKLDMGTLFFFINLGSSKIIDYSRIAKWRPFEKSFRYMYLICLWNWNYLIIITNIIYGFTKIVSTVSELYDGWKKNHSNTEKSFLHIQNL